MQRIREKIDPSQLDIKDTVVSINRVTKVVKGGKNLSFSALVVVGDGHGVVGFGVGKAKEVPSAIKKGIESAKKGLIRVPLSGTTIPHAIVGKFGSGSVLLKPAPDGTGIIAGGAVRAVVEAAGLHNVLTKSLGSANPHNVVRATFNGLECLKEPAMVARLRGKDLEEMSRRSNYEEHEDVEAHMAKKAAKKSADAKRVKVTLVKSTIGFDKKQAAVVESMGLRRLNHTVELADTPSIRGMIHKVRHLITVAE